MIHQRRALFCIVAPAELYHSPQRLTPLSMTQHVRQAGSYPVMRQQIGCIYLPFTLCGFPALTGFASPPGLRVQGILAQLQNCSWVHPGSAISSDLPLALIIF